MYREPHHPYTRGLLESLPIHGDVRQRLRPVPGAPPSVINLPGGCSFHPRCAHVMSRCRTESPPARALGGSRHVSACWLPPDVPRNDERKRDRREGVGT